MAAGQAAVAATNPFVGVPTFVYQLDFSPDRMAWGLSRLMRELQAAVAEQSARENNGVVQVLTHGHGDRHRVLLTPVGGFFALLLRPPPDAAPDNAGDVKLLFSFSDLYLLGFEHQNICHIFKDADLGPGIDIDTNPWVRKMRFKGAYRDGVFKEVQIAVKDMLQTYLTLLNRNEDTPDDEIYRALYRIMVTVSEALRFVEWLRELLCIYKNNRSNPTVDQAGGVYFSDHFRNWSNRSKAVRAGEDAFEGPKYGFNSYDALLSYSGVVMSKDR